MAKSRSKGDSGFHPEKGPRIKPRQGRLCFVFGIPCPFTFAATLGPRPDLFVRLLFGFLRLFSISPSRRPLDQGDWHRERDGDPEKPLRVESATRNTSSVSLHRPASAFRLPNGMPGMPRMPGMPEMPHYRRRRRRRRWLPVFFFLFGFQPTTTGTLWRCSRGCQGCQGCLRFPFHRISVSHLPTRDSFNATEMLERMSRMPGMLRMLQR